MVGVAPLALARRIDSPPQIELRAVGSLEGAIDEIRRRAQSPAGAMLEWRDEGEDEIRALWRVMRELPVLALGPPRAGRWARRLGAELASPDQVGRACGFVHAAHGRLLELHAALGDLARVSRLSTYEAQLAWRWMLGQTADRELEATLHVKKATLDGRKRSLLSRTGALDREELVSWLRPAARGASPWA